MWQPLFGKYFPLLERTEVGGGSGKVPHGAPLKRGNVKRNVEMWNPAEQSAFRKFARQTVSRKGETENRGVRLMGVLGVA